MGENKQINNFFFYDGKNICLREFREADFADVHEYSSDYENVKHMMFGPNTEEQTRAYIEECIGYTKENPRMNYSFAIELLETGKVIGGVALHLNWMRDDGLIGLIINKKYNGHGYATEAIRELLSIAFEDIGLFRVNAVCDVRNTGIAKVLERCGMRKEATYLKRGHARPEEGKKHFDQYGYAILKLEYEIMKNMREIRLLTEKEAKCIPKEILRFRRSWWLETKETQGVKIVYASGRLNVSGANINRFADVRPVIVLANDVLSDINMYEEIDLNQTKWVKISENMLLCNDNSFKQMGILVQITNANIAPEIKRYIVIRAKEFGLLSNQNK